MPSFRPGKPRWRLVNTALPSMAAGFSTLFWSAATFDDVGGWDNDTAYVIDRDGLYLTGAFLSRGSIGSAVQPLLQLRANATAIANTRGSTLAAGTSVAMGELLELNEGDTLDLRVRFTTSGTTTLNDDAVWWGVRVGPVRWV